MTLIITLHIKFLLRVRGFTDAEGYFSIRVSKNLNIIHGIRIVPIFVIERHQRDIGLFLTIKAFFGIGSIRVSKGKKTIYSVKNLK